MMTDQASHHNIQKIDDFRWRVPREGGMRVDGVIYATEEMIRKVVEDQSVDQVANVAHLPGIVKYSLAMPDVHQGYGFPIGGVSAFDPDEGVISPGGVGYDINCGVRLLRTNLRREDIKGAMVPLVERLFMNVPCGVGSERKQFRVGPDKMRHLLREGARWAVKEGFGNREDLDHIEEGGCLEGADPEAVSERAMQRGRDQVGTLGSGNHFVEIGYVAEVYDDAIAQAFGLAPDEVTVLIHTGSRGFGHQTCDDYLKVMMTAASRYKIELPDRELTCAPIRSEEGQRYLGAMKAAANFAFANRQMITHWVRTTFEEVLGMGPRDLGLQVVYDVCHNIAKFEEFEIDGQRQTLCVHRKGATRAYPPHHPHTPRAYAQVGQPVLVPGDMGRRSYVLCGTERAYRETFGSCCHGAGRLMSRTKATRIAKGRPIIRELEDQGIIVRSAGRRTLMEEVPEAYKDVTQVVDVCDAVGIGTKVAQLRPTGVIKG